jgi:hypothetical protein
MNNEDFQALARRGAIDALKAVAAIAVEPTAVASDREHARSMVELMLEASNDISADLRREIENVLHEHRWFMRPSNPPLRCQHAAPGKINAVRKRPVT